jgi:hypothetical protein
MGQINRLLSFSEVALADFETLALISSAIRIFSKPLKPHFFGDVG